MSWRDRLRDTIWGGAAYRPFDYASAGAGLVRLDSNESPFPPGADEMSAFQEELAQLALNRYPDVSGRPLREALARRWRVEPDEILLGNGSEEIISILTIAFGSHAGGAPAQVLYPDPTFNQYEMLARAYGALPAPIPLDASFGLDEARFADEIARRRPALAFFASPNNPSGNRFDAATLVRLAQTMDAAFVVDEAYADFSGETLIPRVRDTPGLFVMRSLSKIGLAGLRVGALVGPRDAIAELDKVRLPWNVNAVSIALGCASLRHVERLEARVRETVALRRQLDVNLRSISGLSVYPSDTNFILVRTPTDAGAVFRELLARGVLVKNVSQPGALDRCLRVTVGTALENERFLRALRASIERLSDHPGGVADEPLSRSDQG
ncbi:MAG TPA: histidinol-phosphate transaminase [Polyangia bacterium]|jgi:histidinol-phosphate aminotransferase|nr:histidinol-phosphate transaminase [Polyangia bacterium]